MYMSSLISFVPTVLHTHTHTHKHTQTRTHARTHAHINIYGRGMIDTNMPL